MFSTSQVYVCAALEFPSGIMLFARIESVCLFDNIQGGLKSNIMVHDKNTHNNILYNGACEKAVRALEYFQFICQREKISRNLE